MLSCLALCTIGSANGLAMMWLVMAASLALCEADSPSVQLMVCVERVICHLGCVLC